jgi:hypothetical protein
VKTRNATSTVVSVFGSLAALAGLEHGIGEALQGSTAPAGIVFPSWPGSAFFRSVAGEPALSLVPNLLASGILSIIVSLVFLVWAIAFPHRKSSGLLLLALSVVLLLVGGGFGPPLLGIVIGVTAIKVRSPLNWWRSRLPAGLRRALATLWPWFLAIAIAAWLLVMPGTMLLEAGALVPVFVLIAFATLALAIITGLARDSLRPEQSPAPQAGSWGSEVRAARR